MRFLIQRVLGSSVSADGEELGRIGKGLLVLIGISKEDTEETADKMIRKLLALRIFEDENGKTNLALSDVSGALLLISQFTLYADLRRGNRPGFTDAGEPDKAKKLYEYIIDACRKAVPCVQKGRFGADMKVSLINDGPFTILLDSAVFDTPRRG